MKVTLGTVHGQEINSWYHHSMVRLLTHNQGLISAKIDVPHTIEDHLCIRSGPLLSAGRGILAGTFLQNTDSDALLMLDSDMVYTPELIYRHIDYFAQCREQHPDLGILAGLAFISSDPRNAHPLPNLYSKRDQHSDQLLQLTNYPQNALVEIEAAGAACIIIAREVIQKFADEKINPFHHIPLLNWGMLARNVAAMDNPAQIEAEMKYAVWGADQCGEDISFCMRVRQAGYKIFSHTGLIYDHAKSTLLGEGEYRTAYGLDAPDVALVAAGGIQ